MADRYTYLPAATVAASVLKQLGPTGKSARIAAILSAGGYTYVFKALLPGTFVLDWYYTPVGAHAVAASKPVLVGSGKLTFSTSGTMRLTVKLETAGRALLAGNRGRAMRLIASASFKPVGAVALTALKAFELDP